MISATINRAIEDDDVSHLQNVFSVQSSQLRCAQCFFLLIFVPSESYQYSLSYDLMTKLGSSWLSSREIAILRNDIIGI